MKFPILPDNRMAEAHARAENSTVHMSGSGDLNFFCAATRLSNARDIVEAGVAHGLMWTEFKFGGVFISEDILDNLAFREFVEARGLGCAVTEYEGKYVGIVRKPSRVSGHT